KPTPINQLTNPQPLDADLVPTDAAIEMPEQTPRQLPWAILAGIGGVVIIGIIALVILLRGQPSANGSNVTNTAAPAIVAMPTLREPPQPTILISVAPTVELPLPVPPTVASTISSPLPPPLPSTSVPPTAAPPTVPPTVQPTVSTSIPPTTLPTAVPAAGLT